MAQPMTSSESVSRSSLSLTSAEASELSAILSPGSNFSQRHHLSSYMSDDNIEYTSAPSISRSTSLSSSTSIAPSKSPSIDDAFASSNWFGFQNNGLSPILPKASSVDSVSSVTSNGSHGSQSNASSPSTSSMSAVAAVEAMLSQLPPALLQQLSTDPQAASQLVAQLHARASMVHSPSLMAPSPSASPGLSDVPGDQRNNAVVVDLHHLASIAHASQHGVSMYHQQQHHSLPHDQHMMFTGNHFLDDDQKTLFDINGKPIPKKKSSAPRERDQVMDSTFSIPSRQLFVGNLSSWIVEKDLQSLFGAFGEIESIKCYYHLRFGFLVFRDLVSAIRAKNACCKKAPVLRGRTMIVNYGKPLEELPVDFYTSDLVVLAANGGPIPSPPPAGHSIMGGLGTSPSAAASPSGFSPPSKRSPGGPFPGSAVAQYGAGGSSSMAAAAAAASSSFSMPHRHSTGGVPASYSHGATKAYPGHNYHLNPPVNYPYSHPHGAQPPSYAHPQPQYQQRSAAGGFGHNAHRQQYPHRHSDFGLSFASSNALPNIPSPGPQQHQQQQLISSGDLSWQQQQHLGTSLRGLQQTPPQSGPQILQPLAQRQQHLSVLDPLVTMARADSASPFQTSSWGSSHVNTPSPANDQQQQQLAAIAALLSATQRQAQNPQSQHQQQLLALLLQQQQQQQQEQQQMQLIQMLIQQQQSSPEQHQPQAASLESTLATLLTQSTGQHPQASSSLSNQWQQSLSSPQQQPIPTPVFVASSESTETFSNSNHALQSAVMESPEMLQMLSQLNLNASPQ